MSNSEKIEAVSCRVRLYLKNSVEYKRNLSGWILKVVDNSVINTSYMFVKHVNSGLFSYISDDRVIIHEDIVYFDFESELDNDCDDTIENIYCVSLNTIRKIWDFIKVDYKSFIDSRSSPVFSRIYITSFNIVDTYCSWSGDGDVYVDLHSVSIFKSGELIKLFEEKYNNRYDE